MDIRVDLGSGRVGTHCDGLDVGVDKLGNLHITTKEGGIIYNHNTWYSVHYYDETEDQSENQ